MSRSYNKKSDYWSKFNKPESSSLPVHNNYEPKLLGESYFTEVAKASYSRPVQGATDTAQSTKIPRNGTDHNIRRYALLSQGMLPYQFSKDGVDIRDAILLCQKAYANVALVRNTIDIATEFANTEIYLEGGTARSREFFTKWFEKIKLWKLKDQYFREYYRSGNIFYYRIDGKFKAEDFKLLSGLSENGVVNNKIPLRYILINPYEIVAKVSASFSEAIYEKLLSEYELERLRNPKDDADRELFKALPADMQKKVKDKAYFRDGLKIKLDPSFLLYSFYKKQDYEPFAIPFTFPIMEDVNAKLELKHIDQAISRTVENVLLLITMGAPPDEGGINPANMAAMQSLFMNESVGRVLVSDHTTKAEFIIPDLKKVVGEEKYKILNQDIKEGLMNVLVGDDKYNGQTAKIGFFMERLKESRNCFLNDILQPEIIRISKDLGFKAYPTAKFKQIDLKDEIQYMRTVSRLMELSIITPEQGIEAMANGKLPSSEELSPAQDKLVEERKKGYYNPLVGGVPMTEDPNAPEPAAPVAAGKPVNKLSRTPTAKPKNSIPGRPLGTKSKASTSDIQSTVYAVDAFMKASEAFTAEKFGVSKLNDQQKSSVIELCKKVVAASSKEEWTTRLQACVQDLGNIEKLQPMKEITDTADEFLLDEYSAAILYHSAVK
jgi:hypothetical protein